MQPNDGVVSVVITTYNQAAFLGEAIESVVAQTYPRVEIVVVDDGSTDGAAAVAAGHPCVSYVKQRNQGVSAARNAGLRRTAGEWVLFLDGDDRLCPDAVEVAVIGLRQHPECAFAYGYAERIDAGGAFLAPADRHRVTTDHYRTWLAHNEIRTPGQVLYRRALLDPPGRGFERTAGHAADFELNLRLARDHEVLCLDEVVIQNRTHENNTSGDPAMMLKSTVEVYRLQRAHVRHDPALAEAHAAGLRAGRAYYGPRLRGRLAAELRSRRWKQAAQDAFTLLRYDREVVLTKVRHRVTRRVRPLGT